MKAKGRAAQETKAPRIDDVVLPELELCGALEVQAESFLEARLLTQLDFTGQDLASLRFVESKLDDVVFHDSALKSASFKESHLCRINAPVFSAPYSRWREVLVENSRLGSMEIYQASFSSVRFAGCKLGYVNMRGADLLDVVFENCTIEELDLGGAKASRVAFPGTKIAKLDINQAVFQDFDLRAADVSELVSIEGLAGATLTEQQVISLAVPLAMSLGIRIDD